MTFKDIENSARNNIATISFLIIATLSSSFLIDVDSLITLIGYDPQNIPHPLDNHTTRQILFVSLVIIFLVIPLRAVTPLVVSYLAFLFVKFLIVGFRQWADNIHLSTNSDRSDDLWKWITDQIFVVQRQYAFAMGCIVFKADLDGLPKDSEIPLDRVKTLLRSRPLGEYKAVALWPGTRVRGFANDDVNIPEFVKRVVRRQTGVQIKLTASEDDELQLLSMPTNGREVENHLHPAPFLIMRQNRPQKNGVPGHVELLYVGEYQSGELQDEDNQWVSCSELDDFPDRRLWPDSRETIDKAARWYRTEYLTRRKSKE